MLDLILINDHSRAHLPFSYGKACLATFLAQKNWKVRLIHPHEISRLPSNPTRFFAVGSWSPDFSHVVHTASILKQKYPEIPVIAGGGHITAWPNSLKKHADIFDYWVLGEGEIAIHEILQGHHAQRVPITRHVTADDLIVPSMAWNPVINGAYTMIVSRGCPHTCSFCNTPGMFGHKTRSIPVDKLVAHVKNLLKQGLVTVSFRDSSFLNDPNWAKEFCTKIITENISFNWFANSCAEQLTEDAVAMMKKAGCIGLQIGIESGSPTILTAMKKAADLAQMTKAISLCKKYSIHTHLNIMYGVLGETRETMAMTRDYCRKMSPDSREAVLYEPFPGTAMFNEAEQRGLLSPYNWSQGILPHLTSTGTMSRAEVIAHARKLWKFGPFYQHLQDARLENNLIFLPGVLLRVMALKILMRWSHPLPPSPMPAVKAIQEKINHYRIALIGRMHLYLYLSVLNT